MTDKQRTVLLKSAMADLRKTEQGYKDSPTGPHWRNALRKLEQLQDDLQPVPVTAVPALGPISKNGRSVLQHDCTHITSALGWPAFDDGFRIGLEILAPEQCVVYDNTSSSQGGDAFYIRGASGIQYWVAHITTVPRQNAKFKKGQVMSRISSDHPRPHVHLAVDARALLGHHLKAHTDYTHGAPTIGQQLAAGMEA